MLEEIKLAEMSDTGRLGISTIKEVEGFKITIIESGGPAFKAGCLTFNLGRIYPVFFSALFTDNNHTIFSLND